MGLMQLLTVGRSVGEAKYRPHRYKLLNGAVPKFGPISGAKVGKNAQLADVQQPGNGAAKMTTSVNEPTMNTEAPETVEKSPATNVSPAGRWALKANPFKSSVKPAPRPIVQGELSLDKVRVVRNDLSDSDLELVAASKASPSTRLNYGNVSAADAKTKRPSFLARIKSRWFRAKAH